MQSFPSGLYHLYEIKSVCLSGGQAEASARARTDSPGSGFCLDGYRPYSSTIAAKKRKGKGKGRGLRAGPHSFQGYQSFAEEKRKGSLLPREKGVGAHGIIRWEFKGGPKYSSVIKSVDPEAY